MKVPASTPLSSHAPLLTRLLHKYVLPFFLSFFLSFSLSFLPFFPFLFIYLIVSRKTLDEKEVGEQLSHLLLAGVEPTRHMLAWVLVHLGSDRKIQRLFYFVLFSFLLFCFILYLVGNSTFVDLFLFGSFSLRHTTEKLRDELNEVLGDLPLSSSARPNLPYLKFFFSSFSPNFSYLFPLANFSTSFRACLREVYRMTPVSAFTSYRVLEKETVIGGYKVLMQ